MIKSLIRKIKRKVRVMKCKNQDLLFAIRLLEETGAGVNNIEQTRKILEDMTMNLKLQPCKGRDEGIIRNYKRRY